VKRISILLLDDESLFRQGLRSLLEKETFINSIYEASNAAEFNRELSSHAIDIVLLDIRLPGIKGHELITSIKTKPNHPKIIAVTGLEGVELIIYLLKAGINGIVFKLDGYSEIVRTIKEVIDSGNYFQDKTLRVIQVNSHRWDKVPTIHLTFQEKELLKAIASGLTTKAIASQLRMTEATTETYRIRLIKKLSVPNTAALLAYAYTNGIL
jgi:DNA-binding NarL/FixJ family response regulator